MEAIIVVFGAQLAVMAAGVLWPKRRDQHEQTDDRRDGPCDSRAHGEEAREHDFTSSDL